MPGSGDWRKAVCRMIVSASRRTDIPAFYGPWFMNRIREGFVLVPNPHNPLHFSRVRLDSQAAECIVFWSKNPEPFLPCLPEIEKRGIPFYFEFTITPYGGVWEGNVPEKREMVSVFRRLSSVVGRERVIWRYDPVIVTEDMPLAYHMQAFEELAERLEGYTDRCLFSFLDMYPHIQSVMKSMGVLVPNDTDKRTAAAGFAVSAERHHIKLGACCEPCLQGIAGCMDAACIDPEDVGKVCGFPVRYRKDPGQRDLCRCMVSVDIGTYDSCRHGCLYCYASRRTHQEKMPVFFHNPVSPVLCGGLPPHAVITDRPMPSAADREISLFSCPGHDCCK